MIDLAVTARKGAKAMLDKQCINCKHLYLGSFSQCDQFCMAPGFRRDPSPNQVRGGEPEPGDGYMPWCHDVVKPNCSEFQPRGK